MLKNDDFRLKNDDSLLKNDDFRLKNVDFMIGRRTITRSERQSQAIPPDFTHIPLQSHSPSITFPFNHIPRQWSECINNDEFRSGR